MDSTENCYTPNLKVFCCKACLKSLKDPVIINACTHRVCRECIEKHIRSYGKYCPECNIEFTKYFSDEVTKVMEKLANVQRSRDEIVINRVHDGPSTSNGNGCGPSNGVDSKNNSLSMINEDYAKTSNEIAEIRNGDHNVNENSNKHDWDDSGTLLDNPMDLDDFVSVILWPDSSVYQTDLPPAAMRPRFVRLPADAIVAHLEEYIFLRLSTESEFAERSKYCIEFTNVLKEGKNYQRGDLHKVNFLWSSKGKDGEFNKSNDMISIPFPWKSVSHQLLMSDAEKNFRLRRSKPLKLVFRFNRKT